MIYQQLYNRSSNKRPVAAGLIGAGSYGTAVLTQSVGSPFLRIPIIADQNPEAARQAFLCAGIPGESIVLCDNRNETLRAMEKGQSVIVEDPLLLMEIPIEVIVEATGIPESGAMHAHEAIRHGKHVAMISKEPDSVVGPILKHLADKAGLVYTPVDGDQHGLLIGLVNWIRSIGLDVLCAGKSRDVEFVFDKDEGWVGPVWETIVPGEKHRYFPPLEDRGYFDFIAEGRARDCTVARSKWLNSLPMAAPFDYCESVIAANATGLVPDTPRLHNPILRIREIPEVLCPIEEGGILGKNGIIDMVTCFRRRHEAGLGGGVFAVVSCSNRYSRDMVISKGLIANRRGTAALIYRPYHLCGVETSTTILCAALLGVPTGSDSYLPRFDMVYQARRDLKKGETLDSNHGNSLDASIVPAIPLNGTGLLPACLGSGKLLKKDVPAGAFITQDAVELPPDSILVSLRKQQDQHFAI